MPPTHSSKTLDHTATPAGIVDGRRAAPTRGEAYDVTDTDADAYCDTVRWAEAAYDAEFDGLVWMSRRCNTDQAYVFVGNRTEQADFELAGDYGRIFSDSSP